ncbi:uncharacterized protein LOC117172052 isoform X2 [Belonocnema kinseyi]|uniref:uncharacterized protein LOC117172052 isoform X2 n=1 Tax=Belonocnema kinseyi TaxID=2817044 RepID=UPI00143D2071|nr:uncharacterized protein LOC117172052 isoform X2 [Belonocnema kinseyi]
MRVSTYTYQDADCTNRSLATLLVAWLGAAMVASVLLRWKYMWIALAILTLLFLIACGYAACSARRSHERIVYENGDRHIVRRRRHSLEHVQTVSRVVDNNYIVEPPSYQTFWVQDLPPTYSAVVRTQVPASIPDYRLTSADDPPIGPRLSNPPSYSIAIGSNHPTAQIGQPANRTLEPNVQNFQSMNQPGGQPWTLPPGHHIVRRQSFSEIAQPNEDKVPKERRRSQSFGVLSSGTGYLSNIISCTFSRGERRTNVEQNDHPPLTSEQRIVISQINSGRNNSKDLKI